MSELRDRIGGFFRRSDPRILVASTVGIATAVYAGFRVFFDYQRWLAVGRGGLPYNFIGYTLQNLLRLRAKETKSVACYTDPKTIAEYPGAGSRSHLDHPLPTRTGSRPGIEPYLVPHRLTTGNALEIRQASQALFEVIASSNPTIITVKPSKLENHGRAIWISEGYPLPSWRKRVRGEILHIHPSDGSMHVSLSLPDAKEIIEKGWGERHPLSGYLMPLGYLLIYAPRTADELEIIGHILRAGIKAMTGGKDVK